MIEKLFSQLKTDSVVAPVFLEEVSRVEALLCVYFLELLPDSLLERELRRALERAEVERLLLCPEGRACRRPTARRVIDRFEDVQRHERINADWEIAASQSLPRLRSPELPLGWSCQLADVSATFSRVVGVTSRS
jgi:hypothetical protein